MPAAPRLPAQLFPSQARKQSARESAVSERFRVPYAHFEGERLGQLTKCTWVTVFPRFNVRGVHSAALTVQNAPFTALTLENDPSCLPWAGGRRVCFSEMYFACTTSALQLGKHLPPPAGTRVTVEAPETCVTYGIPAIGAPHPRLSEPSRPHAPGGETRRGSRGFPMRPPARKPRLHPSSEYPRTIPRKCPHRIRPHSAGYHAGGAPRQPPAPPQHKELGFPPRARDAAPQTPREGTAQPCAIHSR